MINKVNPPPKLVLLQSSKQMENDPGSNQGSGVAYDAPNQTQDTSLEKSDAIDTESTEATLSTQAADLKPVANVSSSPNQIGLTRVLMDFKENHPEQELAQAGLGNRYQQADSTPAKGVLLNRKA